MGHLRQGPVCDCGHRFCTGYALTGVNSPHGFMPQHHVTARTLHCQKRHCIPNSSTCLSVHALRSHSRGKTHLITQRETACKKSRFSRSMQLSGCVAAPSVPKRAAAPARAAVATPWRGASRSMQRTGPERRGVVAAAAAPINPFSLALAAGCAALAASGAVPGHDLAFSAAWPAYLYMVNRWRFRRNAALGGERPGALVPEPWVRRCVVSHMGSRQ